MYIATSTLRASHHQAFFDMMKQGDLTPQQAEDIVEAGSQLKLGAHSKDCDWKAIMATF